MDKRSQEVSTLTETQEVLFNLEKTELGMGGNSSSNYYCVCVFVLEKKYETGERGLLLDEHADKYARSKWKPKEIKHCQKSAKRSSHAWYYQTALELAESAVGTHKSF